MEKRKGKQGLIISLDDYIDGSTNFKWKEALFIPGWNLYAIPKNEMIIENIIKTTSKLDEIRKLYDLPISITSFWRPVDYNVKIRGSRESAHIDGLACDFIINGKPSEEIRQELAPELDSLGIRMEANKTAHVHIDLKYCSEKVLLSGRRFFRA